MSALLTRFAAAVAAEAAPASSVTLSMAKRALPTGVEEGGAAARADMLLAVGLTGTEAIEEK